MNRVLGLVLVIVVSCKTIKNTDCNYIEDYYQTMYKADLEFETGNYTKAFELYEISFKHCEAKNTLTFNEIANFTESSAILKKFDITYEYAKKQILNGVTLNRFENNNNFIDFLSSNHGQKLIKEYNVLRKSFESNANFQLRDEIISMRQADQMYRNKDYSKNISKQDSIDKIHEKRLIEIFETIGYPTEKILGQNTMEYPVNLEILLLHTKDSIRMNYFVPKIREFVKNGTATPLTLGRIIDQYYLYNDEPQIYGTYSNQNGGFANIIADLKKVNNNRISIGLSPIELKKKKDSIIKVKYGF